LKYIINDILLEERNMKKKKTSIMVENAHYMGGIAYITLYADGIIHS